jgi:multidrug efflux pump subunit AcrB
MNISQLFIERPIMTVLVCFSIVLFGDGGVSRAAGGGAAQRRLPHHYGERRLPGASPETMASTVATPLERSSPPSPAFRK